MDSAFTRFDQDMHGKIMRAQKENERSNILETAKLAAVDALLERAMPSERKSAQWCVRAFKGPFKRLSVPLPANGHRRYRLLRICMHMYNFRVRHAGLNQLHNVYSDLETLVQPWVLELTQSG